MRKPLLVLSILLLSYSSGICQFQSVGLNLYASQYLDKPKDTEYDYERVFDGLLAQFSVTYNRNISSKIVWLNSLGMSIGGGNYTNVQFMTGSGSIEDRTVVEKNKRVNFLKLGSGISYWFTNLGEGPYFKSELVLNILLSAKSNEMRKFDSEPYVNTQVDFKEDLKSVMPILKLGFGYNLPFTKNWFINGGVFLDVRAGSYYRDEDQFTFLNRGLEFGTCYIFSR